MAAVAPSQTPFPWAMGILRKDVPSRPSHGNRSHSGSTSSTDSNRIKIIDLTQHEALMKKEMAYQERYLSSEEDLSPVDEDFDDTESLKSFDLDDLSDLEEKEEDETGYDTEQPVEAYSGRSEKPWKSELAAKVISIIYSGRPQVVDIVPTPNTSPTTAQRPAQEFEFKRAPNWSRPRPILQHSRVATLSVCEYAEAPKPEADQASIISESQRSERRHSSIYSVASPPSPRFFNPLRRNSLIVEPALLGAPAVPQLPASSTGEPKLRHSRMKSISKMGFFKTNKKDRKDAAAATTTNNLTSASMVHLGTTAAPPPVPTTPRSYAPTAPSSAAALARSATTTTSSTFAPPPFIRLQGGRLVARGAGDREDPAWSSMLGRRPTTATARQYDGYGDDELSDDDEEHARERRHPAVAAKIRKRRSLLGLNY